MHTSPACYHTAVSPTLVCDAQSGGTPPSYYRNIYNLPLNELTMNEERLKVLTAAIGRWLCFGLLLRVVW
jgi:hypothetical protein